MSKSQPKISAKRKTALKSVAPTPRKPKPVSSKKVVAKKKANAKKKVVVKKKVAVEKKVAAKKTPTRKIVAKKTSTPKKAPVKKVVANQKTAPKKPTVKKASAKPVSKTLAKKAPVKTVSVKTARTKAAPSAKPPKETLATLRGHVDNIVKRLKTADTLTRKNVKSLETAFEVLEKQVKDHHTVNHAALTRRVDQLSTQLKHNISSTKSEIAADLKAALDNPTITGLQAAIGKSEMRLSHAEMAQSQALAKINRHIAELARVIDARLKSNVQTTKANAQQIGSLQDQVASFDGKTESRISAVENSTATAMRSLGDNLVTAAEQFQTKLDQQNVMLREKIAEIGLQTSKDFDHYKTETSDRINKLEDDRRNQSDYMDRAITKLATRIDNLEYGLSDLSDTAPEKPVSAAYIAEVPQVAEIAQTPESNLPAATSVEDAFLLAEQALSEPADTNITNIASYEMAPQEIPANGNPYSSDQGNVSSGQMGAPSYTAAPDAFSPAPEKIVAADVVAPQIYQPAPPAPQMAQQHHYVDPAQAAFTNQMQAGNAAYDTQTQAYPQTQPQYSQDHDGPVEFVPSQGLQPMDLPYADPAYAENDQSQGVSRPGHVESKGKKSKRKLGLKDGVALPNVPGLTPRNLRVAGLAVVLATVGYFGLRSFTGGPDKIVTANNSTNTIQTVSPETTAPLSIATMEPIGEYQDNLGTLETQVPTQSIQSADAGAAVTLEQAADGGDAIAQFQLGLHYLDAGRPAEGIKFIRASANQGQPAAQYRLAKLYESGIGVQADPDMARQLTERAARSGNRIAMHDLGLYYADGLGGVDRDITTALSWFEKAAERGVVDSQYNLGVLFESSPEVPKDALTSYVWYSIAATQGDQVAASRLPILKNDLSSEQLEQAERRIAQFKPTDIDDAANGVFRDVSWTMPNTASLLPSTDLVRDAQALLGQLGYEVGTPDGAIGPKTRAAITAFEKANGMAETGAVSASLVDRLEAAAGV